MVNDDGQAIYHLSLYNCFFAAAQVKHVTVSPNDSRLINDVIHHPRHQSMCPGSGIDTGSTLFFSSQRCLHWGTSLESISYIFFSFLSRMYFKAPGHMFGLACAHSSGYIWCTHYHLLPLALEKKNVHN